MLSTMGLRDPVLALHIASGSAGLLLGPLAMTAPKRRGRHTRAGGAYHWTMLVVCLSAGTLAVLDWGRIWWFLPIAAFSYANALLGYLAVKIRWPGWLRQHIAGMGGSYIALITALLVVNVGTQLPIAWFLPTILGAPIIAWTLNEVDRGRRPKRASSASQQHG
jgi:uncharacterized membrane protein YeaQ/YmgE (transglycosylase-associated protein family)